MRIVGRVMLYALLAVAAVAAAGMAFLYYEAWSPPSRSGEYVALGSSFAAGPKLGPLASRSPHACWRTSDNYPHQLARMASLQLVDVSCGGATTTNLLEGGPFFQKPQVEAVGEAARLVTITVGGNDVGYIGDLGLLAYRSRRGVLGSLVRSLWGGPHSADARPFDELQQHLNDLVTEVRRRAPQATVVLVTYPQVLPGEGTCPALEIDERDVAAMRAVGLKLADVTKSAAAHSGALLVDMMSVSAGHDACSAEPWVNGASPSDGAMFHPTLAGAQAMASAIQRLVFQQSARRSPHGAAH